MQYWRHSYDHLLERQRTADRQRRPNPYLDRIFLQSTGRSDTVLVFESQTRNEDKQTSCSKHARDLRHALVLDTNQAVDSETFDDFKHRLTTAFQKMMYVSGETAEASPETTYLIEEIVREQVVEMVSSPILLDQP